MSRKNSNSNTRRGVGKAPEKNKGVEKKQTAKNTSNKSKYNAKKGQKPNAVYIGTIDCNVKGFGFFCCKELEDDVFIPASKLNGAMHGDTVKVEILSCNKGSGEGAVLEVISCADNVIVGKYKVFNGYGVVEPDNGRVYPEIFIPKGCEKTAKDNDKVTVVVKLNGSSRSLEGEVKDVLGQCGDKGVDIISVIRSHKLYEKFPNGVEAVANEITEEITAEERKRRNDFTDDLIITIDGDDSRDFDDAVSLTKTDSGLYKLSVHIADVAHYVTFGSKIDKEAYKRGTSVYFPSLVLPMLPKNLSDNICSLKENVERLALSCIMEIDNSGKVVKHKICEGIIKSRHRLTYKKVTKILEGDKELSKEYNNVVPMLFEMEKLCKILFKKRMARGAVEFDITESEITVDDSGKVIDVVKKPRLVSHRIIEEFMLIANETVAEHMFKLEAPFVYRTHEPPSSEKCGALNEFLKSVGVTTTINADAPSPMQFKQLLEKLEENISPTVNRVALRSMTKAAYEPLNKGHFGLAAENYCHFTSPIRRYPDLTIHRIIKDYLNNGNSCFKKYVKFVADASEHSSETERAAEKAEREVDDIKKAEYMADKIGQNYSGIISGVTDFGIFVELDNSVEGLVRLDKLKGDKYVLSQKNMTLSNGIYSYRIGGRVNVSVEAVGFDRVSFILND